MKNKIITIILIVMIGMIAFWYLTKTDSTDSYLSTDSQTTGSADAKYLYNILQKMAKVSLDDSIFSNSDFKQLKDNTVSFSAQDSGRSNPFAPVGSDVNTNINQSTTSSSTKTK